VLEVPEAGGSVAFGLGLPKGSSELPSFSQILRIAFHTWGKRLMTAPIVRSRTVRSSRRGEAEALLDIMRTDSRAATTADVLRVMPESFPGDSYACQHGSRNAALSIKGARKEGQTVLRRVQTAQELGKCAPLSRFRLASLPAMHYLFAEKSSPFTPC
jgi:hypothetical protein